MDNGNSPDNDKRHYRSSIECLPVHLVLDEIKPFIPRHYEEVGYPAIEPDWEQYRKLGEAGVYWMVTKRINGKIVGYVGFVIYQHLHFNERSAEIDTVFLLPELRGVASYRLVKEAIENIKTMNVRRIRAVEKNTGLIRILSRLGFKQSDEKIMNMECK